MHQTPIAEELQQWATRAPVTQASATHAPTGTPEPAAKIPHPRPTPEPVVLADRPDGTVIRIGDVVSKAHAPGTDPAALAARLHVAAHPRLRGVLLPPLPVAGDGGLLGRLHDGRPASLWPMGRPVAPDDPAAAPWEEAATLLARLHSTPPAELALPGPVPPTRGTAGPIGGPVPAIDRTAAPIGGPLPPMGGPAKVARAVARLAEAAPVSPAARDAVRRAWRGLPPWARDEAPHATDTAPRGGGTTPGATPVGSRGLCHGDWHLGQLVRHPAPDGPWLLIDVDDLGIGDPAWDLARPAAWFAVGFLAPEVWQRFLDAYRRAGGPAVRPEGDPWPQLDVPARALTVQTAALALARAAAEGRAPDEDEEALVDGCVRIAELGSGDMSSCVST
ncbi:phosphotransferase [Streptomyces sp. NPDC047108]|uniref:phosphotransferase n=1 Tax=Streptomyces sp. NPDC047108 TaxID=3155025 RepID=UPI0033D9D5D8